MKRSIIVVQFALCGMFFIGCAVGLLSTTKTFTGHYSIVLKESKDDILDIIANVGKSMEYEVSSIDKQNNSIGLTDQTSRATTALIGKTSRSTINFSIKKNLKIIDTRITLVGNFDYANQENADKIIEEFKIKLYEKLNTVGIKSSSDTSGIIGNCVWQ